MSKILIVEVDPDMVLGLKDNFEFEGYEVTTATDGQSGFPKGPYPGSTSGQVYNEAPNTLTTASDCWPLPTNEINFNPNIPKG